MLEKCRSFFITARYLILLAFSANYRRRRRAIKVVSDWLIYEERLRQSALEARRLESDSGSLHRRYTDRSQTHRSSQ